MKELHILIQPIGEISPKLVQELCRALEVLLAAECRVQPAIDLPRRAFVPERRQFLANYLLRLLNDDPRCRSGNCKILGVTDQDIFAPGRTFVFGQAIVAGKVGVISTKRLTPGGESTSWLFPSSEEDEQAGAMAAGRAPGLQADGSGHCRSQEDLIVRTLKEAVHEIGHTLGLQHCSDARCVMSFSESLTQADRKGVYYCPRCMGKLAA